MEIKKVKIAIIGATGATGREIVRCLKLDERVEELALICRKPLEEWKVNAEGVSDFKCKLTIIEMENFDDMTELKAKLAGFDVFLCTLGSRY